MTKFKRGDKVVLVKHDDESELNLDIGDKGKVWSNMPNQNGWIHVLWPDAECPGWWVSPDSIKKDVPMYMENK